MEIYREFFKETLSDIKAFHDFDSMGHLDYIVRYGRKKAADYRYRDYADIIDEILKLLIRYNISWSLTRQESGSSSVSRIRIRKS